MKIESPQENSLDRLGEARGAAFGWYEATAREQIAIKVRYTNAPKIILYGRKQPKSQVESKGVQSLNFPVSVCLLFHALSQKI